MPGFLRQHAARGILLMTMMITVGVVAFQSWWHLKSGTNLPLPAWKKLYIQQDAANRSEINCASNYQAAAIALRDFAPEVITYPELKMLHPCMTRHSTNGLPEYQLDDVIVLVMASSKTKERMQAINDSWRRYFKWVYAFSDETDHDLRTTTLPELAGRKSYRDAQHRQLRGFLWLRDNNSLGSAKWVLFVDDDTWVNPVTLHMLINELDHRIPLCMCSIVPSVRNRRDYDFCWGGAGMLFSRVAADSLAPFLYSERVSVGYDNNNDMLLGRCAREAGVRNVHWSLFVPRYMDSDDTGLFEWPAMLTAIAIHNVPPAQMRALCSLLETRLPGVMERYSSAIA